MLILTKIKVMKEPFSRRLKTWNNDIFVPNCPFGCGEEDDEEHAILKCQTTILKNVRN